jgi:UDP-N-acetylglucosamine--N-acetylmuramyl-(pentapeptide) pyrophosphoryl-undecaprenol N-acetylglucosamine transferase
MQIIWQTGKPYAGKGKQRGQGKKGVYVNDFITQMEKGYAAADLVISRSGAMAIAELCLVKKPVLFVPYPHAAEDHQTVNAMNLVNRNAALMVKDSDAVTELVPAIIALARNEEKQNEL